MAEFPIGLDYAWLACDADGHVAMLTNAGPGPIPVAVLDQRVTADRAEEFVRRLPFIDGYTLLVRFPRPDDYVGWAKRGLYAYDWRQEAERYEVIATPDRPLSVNDLHPELTQLASLAVLSRLRFADSPVLYEGELGECRHY